jgi:predicted PhzF superfamily epimerase YddE/YHI9
MSLPIVQVDAFTNHAFGGNPAAVCVLPEPKDTAWMQSVALEMNLSETAFLEKRSEGSYGLRWFTPSVEVDLCGHATLASAHALWESGQLAQGEEARFHTRSGLLTAKQAGEWIELDFPAKLETASEPPPGLLEALGARPKYVGKNQFDYLVEVEESDLLKMSPNHGLLRTIPVRGVIVTSKSTDPAFDFISRFFAPGSGIDEDPVTGSAHTALTPFWASRLGKTTMMARQASARGGVLRVTLKGDRVLMGGQAVTTLRGELLV